MKALKKLGDFDSLFKFLIMELLALVCFMLGNANIVFYIVGTILTILVGLSVVNKFSKSELPSLITIFVPILLISIFVSFGNFSSSAGIATNLFTFLGINAFFLLGIIFRRLSKNDISKVLICIYSGFALIVFISLFYTWIRYGLFYTLIYKNTPIYYYDGELFNITKEQGWLSGLSFQEVSLQYSGLFGVILCSALVPLSFIRIKQNKTQFILYAVFSILGILSLISIVNLEALYYLIPIIIVSVLLHLLTSEQISDKTKKIIKKIVFIIVVSLITLVLVFFIFALLNATGYNAATGYSYTVEPTSSLSISIKNNWFLNKLFNNGRIMQPINAILNQAVISYNLFGFKNGGYMYPLTQDAIKFESHMFEIELIKEGGIFAFIILFALILLIIQLIARYFKKSKDDIVIKSTLITLVILIFIYESFSHSSFPIVHEQSSYNSFFRSLPCLIFLFVLGLIFYPQLKNNEVPIFERETNNDNADNKKSDSANKIVIDEDNDYSFSAETTGDDNK